MEPCKVFSSRHNFNRLLRIALFNYPIKRASHSHVTRIIKITRIKTKSLFSYNICDGQLKLDNCRQHALWFYRPHSH